MAHELMMGQRGGGSPVGYSKVGPPRPIDNPDAHRWAILRPVYTPSSFTIAFPNPYDNFQSAIHIPIVAPGGTTNGTITKMVAKDVYPIAENMQNGADAISAGNITSQVMLQKIRGDGYSVSPMGGDGNPSMACVSCSYYKCPADNKTYVFALVSINYTPSGQTYGYYALIIDFASFTITKTFLIGNGGVNGQDLQVRNNRCRVFFGDGDNTLTATVYLAGSAKWNSLQFDYSTVVPTTISVSSQSVDQDETGNNDAFLMMTIFKNKFAAYCSRSHIDDSDTSDGEVIVFANGYETTISYTGSTSAMPFDGCRFSSGSKTSVPVFAPIAHPLSPDYIMTQHITSMDVGGNSSAMERRYNVKINNYIWSYQDAINWVKDAIAYQYGEKSIPQALL